MMDANTARGASSPANPACGAGPKRGAGEVSPSQHAGPQTRRKHPAGGALVDYGGSASVGQSEWAICKSSILIGRTFSVKHTQSYFTTLSENHDRWRAMCLFPAHYYRPYRLIHSNDLWIIVRVGGTERDLRRPSYRALCSQPLLQVVYIHTILSSILT